jgi:PST family polysaccharide transporter
MQTSANLSPSEAHMSDDPGSGLSDLGPPLSAVPGIQPLPAVAAGKPPRELLYAAIGKSITGRYFSYAVQLVSLMILARIFTPRQFGVIAAVQVFYIFFQMCAEIGFGPAIINATSLSRSELGGIFLFTTLTGVALGGFFLALSRPFQQFYSLPALSKVVPFAAGALVFYAAAVVPLAALNRDMRFLRVAQATAIGDAASTGIAVLLSRFIDPVSALASKMLLTAAVQFIMLYALSSGTELGRPLFSLQFQALRQIWWFSKYQFSFGFVLYFSRNLDNLLVGRVFGAAPLGIYDKAYQLMKYPLMLLTFAMTPAIQPAIRKHSDDPQHVESLHREFTYRLAWLGAAAGVGCAVAAPWIVRLLLGPHWAPVTPIVRALALSISTQVVLSTIGSFFQAMNRPDLLLLTGVISAVLIVTAIFFGIRSNDLVMLAWLLSCSFNLAFVISYFVLYRYVFHVSPWTFFRSLSAQIILNFLMLLIGSPAVLSLVRA